MAIDFTELRGGGLAPCPVLGDGQPVTLLALPDVPVLGFPAHGVLGGELMPVDTGVSTGHRMGPMINLVEGVLGVGAVDNVGRDVIELVPVEVTSDKSIRSWTVKYQSYDVVNFEASFGPQIVVESDAGVPLLVNSCFKDTARRTGSTQGENVSLVIDSVSTEPRNIYPIVVHADDYTRHCSVDVRRSEGVT